MVELDLSECINLHIEKINGILSLFSEFKWNVLLWKYRKVMTDVASCSNKGKQVKKKYPNFPILKKLLQPFSKFTRCTWMHHKVPLCVSNWQKHRYGAKQLACKWHQNVAALVFYMTIFGANFYLAVWRIVLRDLSQLGKKYTHIRPLAPSVSDSYSYNCIHASCRNCAREENKAYNKAYCVSAIEKLRMWWHSVV